MVVGVNDDTIVVDTGWQRRSGPEHDADRQALPDGDIAQIAIDGAYYPRAGQPAFTGTVPVRFPDDDDPVIQELGLTLNRLAVGLARNNFV